MNDKARPRERKANGTRQERAITDHRMASPLVTPLCGVTHLFGALRHGRRRGLGAERRGMRYTAERCNEGRERPEITS